tara:strand:+ start:12933 stop:15155 length:2223 start_codon:yes stop_codon:yes gene_type:complete
MSNINFSNNIFLGRLELERFQQFMQDDGYQRFIKENAIQYGLLDNSVDGNFTNARVVEGSADNTIRVNTILGINNDGKFISSPAQTSDIAVGSSGADTNPYWVKLVRAETTIESGTIDISVDGTLNGTGTTFLTSLRGQVTDFPTKIRFPNSATNTGEYNILEVTNDATAELNVVSMTAESNQEWEIVPTSTPGAVLTETEKDLFNFDHYTITLEAESGLTLLNGLPTPVDGEFWLARVQNSGVNVTVEDKRANYIFKTVDGYFTSYLERSINPLVGVEAIKFQDPTQPRSENIVEVAFGMRSTNWTFDATANRITIVSGEGGKFKDTTDFTDGDFDGWRLYYESGKYSIVSGSTLSGNQINLNLGELDVDELSNGSQQLLVVPDTSEVELFFTPSSTTPLDIVKLTFPVNTPVCRCELPVTATTSDYVVTYRHRHIKDYGAQLTIPDDATNGYFTEASFNDDGSLKAAPDRVQATYTSGTITLNESLSSYSNRISNVETGDLFGVRILELDASTINNQIVAGSDFKEQIFITPSQVTLSANKHINLRTTGAVAGNIFFLRFTSCDIVLDSNEFSVVQEWDGTSPLVDSGSSMNLRLFNFHDLYLYLATNDSVLLKFVFDGTDWKLALDNSPVVEEWTAIPNQNTTDYDIISNAFYRKNGSRVEFKGQIEIVQNVGSPFATIFTLPTGYRPLNTLNIAAARDGFALTSVYNININSSGNMVGFNSSVNDIFVDGLSFSLI